MCADHNAWCVCTGAFKLAKHTGSEHTGRPSHRLSTVHASWQGRQTGDFTAATIPSGQTNTGLHCCFIFSMDSPRAY